MIYAYTTLLMSNAKILPQRMSQYRPGLQIDVALGLQGEVFTRDELRTLAGDGAVLAGTMRQVNQCTAGFEQAAADGGVYAGYAVSGGSPRERGIRPTRNYPL
ncbi:hypothetical protein BUE93_11005 [Chromobacterium amazonense]|uniref:Uncharacterized protein n=1 Tax=Chromobacterium amazonense TaxID=1382803 RepID=A0A2S9X533_9NEIS|nr:hypothetical protein BUE93_11005 [Chromobacterium amazonense]